MATITTSLVVDFNAGDDEGILTAEVDGFPDGLNDGVTSFVPGDAPGFLIYKTSNVKVDGIYSSAGSIAVLGSDFSPELIEEDLIFTDSKTATVSKPIYSDFSSVWLGNDLGSPTYTESTIKIPAVGVGVLRVRYKSFFGKFRLSNVPSVLSGESSYSVVVYVVGHTV